jgi:murein L,D-transpeptidase YafK
MKRTAFIITVLLLVLGFVRGQGQTAATTFTAVMNSNEKTEPTFRLLIKKSARKLLVYRTAEGKEQLFKTFTMALGFAPTGHKIQQGDGRTPEGDYYLTHRNPKSKFYLSLGVSYPNAQDAAVGLKKKLITQAEHDAIVNAIRAQAKPPQNTKLGGDIFIHGGGKASDWTWGCVALENEEIKELFDLLPLKTPIRIEP